MLAKQIISILVITFFLQTVKAQDVDWAKTKNWKIYKINDKKAYAYTADTLKNFRYAELNPSELQSLISGVRTLPVEEKPIWMGFMIGSFEAVDGSIHKIEISYYAGFFFDDATKRYYMVLENNRRDWLDFVGETLQSLSEK